MNVGPDGSLCRITSSLKDLINNVKIIKVPDSEPTYRLALIKTNDKDKESSNESDEEISEDESLSKNIENEELINKKFDVVKKPNKTINEGVMRGHNHSKRKHHHKRNNNFGHKNNSYNHKSKKYLPNMKGAFEYGNRDFNSAARQKFNSAASLKFSSAPSQKFSSAPSLKFSSAPSLKFNSPPSLKFNSAPSLNFNSSANRDFISNASPNLPYNNDNFQHSLNYSTEPSPWLEPPVMLPNPFLFPVVTLPENLRNPFGLLGDRPSYAPSLDQNSSYTPMVSNFQSNAKNDVFISDQTSVYPSRPSNAHNSSFVHNQSSSFSQMTSNSHNHSFVHNKNSFAQIASNKLVDKFVHNKKYWNGDYGNYHKNDQFGNKHLNHKSKRAQKSWNKKNKYQNIRNNSSRNNTSYVYRN